MNELNNLGDPAARIKRINKLLADHQAAILELSRLRREAISEFGALSQGSLAKTLGMNRGRINQLLTPISTPQKTFLAWGPDPITVLVGSKVATASAPHQGYLGSAVIDEINALADEMRLPVIYEEIVAGGVVNLNRGNLIVACGPSLSPIIATVLQADPHLRFQQDSGGWFIENLQSSEQYRSPRDASPPEDADYGYLGRLPRPDRKGSFLCVAGLHFSGTVGVIHFLRNNVDRLHAELGRKRFSALVRSDYDTTLGQVVKSQSLLIARHER